jgi:hypothetical protein
MPGMPQRINFCPITPECSKRLLYIDVPLEEVKPENVFYISAREGLIPHVCTIHGASGIPEFIYLGEFLNSRTKRTRYMGPFRTRKQAEIPPKDDKLDPKRRQVGRSGEWTLVKTHVSKPAWKTAPTK